MGEESVKQSRVFKGVALSLIHISHADMKISVGLRSINLQAVVRFVRSRQAGLEAVGMDLEDRAKLRRLLLSVSEPRTE